MSVFEGKLTLLTVREMKSLDAREQVYLLKSLADYLGIIGLCLYRSPPAHPLNAARRLANRCAKEGNMVRRPKS